MTKYREQMQKIIKLEKQEVTAQHFFQNDVTKVNIILNKKKNVIFIKNYFKNLQNKTDQVAEMVTIMKQAIDMDEHLTNEKDEKLECLLTENRGLRELLNIKNKYYVNYETNSNNNSYAKEDKDVQTVSDTTTIVTELTS